MAASQLDTDLAQSLDEAAGVLILLEPSDLPGLAELHTRLEAMASGLTAAGYDRAVRAIELASQQVEAVVLDEVEEPAAALELVSRTVTAVQQVVRDGRAEAEVSWPDEQGEAVAAAAAPVVEELSDQPLTGDPSLLADFVQEANEHLAAADQHLLQLETEPGDSEAIDAVFRAFHTIKGVAGFLGLDQIGHAAHEAENLLDQVRKGRLLLEGPAVDVSFEAVDTLKKLVGAVQEALATGGLLKSYAEVPRLVARLKAVAISEPGAKLGELLVSSGLVAEEQVDAALKAQRESDVPQRLGQQLVKEHQVDAQDVALALRTQRTTVARPQVQVGEAVKVDAERLDRILDTIGELVIAQSMVSQADELRTVSSSTLQGALSQVDKITRELQQLGTSLRMVPVRGTFQKMARLVRDLAKKTGKSVEFVAVGEDTELDKTVVDQIGDPLIHMIRNAVDHGLEANAAARVAAGKAETGVVTLRAFHKGGNIIIEVEDDGRGLDKDAILAKAISRGLVKPGETPTEREIFNLVFEPGFSTAKQVTDVSGRGVGMDVVRRNIENLRGQIEIRSELGHGSVFSMRLPLTLAIIDGMVVRVGSQRYIVPTLSIVTSVQPTQETLSSMLGRAEMLAVQGRHVPLCRLAETFGVTDAETDPRRGLAVVVEEDGRQAAILTDELLGQQQIVIKSLGEALQGVPGLAGGAVMPDGRVGLIVDVASLIRLAAGDAERVRHSVGEAVGEAVEA